MTWMLDLDTILHVFNVRPVTSVLPLLIVCFQTELAMDTLAVAHDIRLDGAKMHATVSGVRSPGAC